MVKIKFHILLMIFIGNLLAIGIEKYPNWFCGYYNATDNGDIIAYDKNDVRIGNKGHIKGYLRNKVDVSQVPDKAIQLCLSNFNKNIIYVLIHNEFYGICIKDSNVIKLPFFLPVDFSNFMLTPDGNDLYIQLDSAKITYHLNAQTFEIVRQTKEWPLFESSFNIKYRYFSKDFAKIFFVGRLNRTDEIKSIYIIDRKSDKVIETISNVQYRMKDACYAVVVDIDNDVALINQVIKNSSGKIYKVIMQGYDLNTKNIQFNTLVNPEIKCVSKLANENKLLVLRGYELKNQIISFKNIYLYRTTDNKLIKEIQGDEIENVKLFSKRMDLNFKDNKTVKCDLDSIFLIK